MQIKNIGLGNGKWEKLLPSNSREHVNKYDKWSMEIYCKRESTKVWINLGAMSK